MKTMIFCMYTNLLFKGGFSFSLPFLHLLFQFYAKWFFFLWFIFSCTKMINFSIKKFIFWDRTIRNNSNYHLFLSLCGRGNTDKMIIISTEAICLKMFGFSLFTFWDSFFFIFQKYANLSRCTELKFLYLLLIETSIQCSKERLFGKRFL